MYVFFCENVKKANFNFINFFIFLENPKVDGFFRGCMMDRSVGGIQFLRVNIIYSMREKGDWNGKGYYHLVPLGERSGLPDQSVPRTGSHGGPAKIT